MEKWQFFRAATTGLGKYSTDVYHPIGVYRIGVYRVKSHVTGLLHKLGQLLLGECSIISPTTGSRNSQHSSYINGL